MMMVHELKESQHQYGGGGVGFSSQVNYCE